MLRAQQTSHELSAEGGALVGGSLGHWLSDFWGIGFLAVKLREGRSIMAAHAGTAGNGFHAGRFLIFLTLVLLLAQACGLL